MSMGSSSFRKEYGDFPKVFLHTGDCFVGVQPTLVTTVLGSCVAVTMFCPTKCISTICHAFLPGAEGGRRKGRDPQPCRFVNDAVDTMLSSLARLGAGIDELEVKILGGASGLGGLPKGSSRFNMAQRNLDMAEKVLAQHGVQVRGRHVGGNRGRKFHMLTHTGEIWVKRLSRMASAESALRQGSYRK